MNTGERNEKYENDRYKLCEDRGISSLIAWLISFRFLSKLEIQYFFVSNNNCSEKISSIFWKGNSLTVTTGKDYSINSVLDCFTGCLSTHQPDVQITVSGVNVMVVHFLLPVYRN